MPMGCVPALRRLCCWAAWPSLHAGGIPLGIVCARALYCVFHLSDFWETYENPWLMLRFFDGGLAMPGLLAGLALAAVISARLVKARPAAVLDLMCIPLGLSIAPG